MTHFRDCRHNLVKYSPQDVRAMVTFSANQSINQGSWNHPHDIASTRSLPVHSANLHDMFEKTVFQAKVEKIFFLFSYLEPEGECNIVDKLAPAFMSPVLAPSMRPWGMNLYSPGSFGIALANTRGEDMASSWTAPFQSNIVNFISGKDLFGDHL